MNILFLSPRQCLPLQSGAKLREYHFLRALAARGDLTYVHFTVPAATALTADDLPFCRDVISVPKPGSYSPAKLAQGVLGETPLTLLNYQSAAMNERVAGLQHTRKFDVIHADSIHMVHATAAAAALWPDATVVYNWHNIESEALDRYSETVASYPRRWYASMTAGKLRAVEQALLASPAAHVVCSAREQQLLLRCNSRARVHVAENGVDSTYFTADDTRYAPGVRLVFVGSMDYAPNADGIVAFVKNIWPAIRAQYPDATLTVVGSNPGPAVQAIGAQAGVTVTGTVPDVRPYYRDALVSIAPLRTGGGTRLKILEAMAMGTPVISSPIGAEGLAVTPGTDVLFADADTPSAWLRAIDAIASSSTYWARLSAASRQLVESRYDWHSIGHGLVEAYDRWAGERVA